MTWESEAHGYAFLATNAADGSPRVHPVAPITTRTAVHLAVTATSPKLRDLRRDPRFALRSSVHPPGDSMVLLGLNPQFVLATTWHDGVPRRQGWRAPG